VEQIGQAVTFYAFFQASGLGATGLTVTVDVWNPAGTQIVTGGSATAIGGGFYKYTLASGSVTAAGGYLCVFKTAGTADQQHVPSFWAVGSVWVEHLDADVSAVGGGGTLYGESGPVTFTYTVHGQDGVTPVEGASVQVSSDIAGELRSQAKVTDSLGRVQFSLLEGTVYFWVTARGLTFNNPDTEVVNAS
jgi:hypothetical protein